MPHSNRRTLAAGTLGCLAAAAVAAAPAAARHAGGAPPCTPKIGTVKGHRAAMNCGPATATLHLGGKSYTFRNGLCEASGSTLILSLGTLVLGVPGNAGLPYLELTMVSAHIASVGEATFGGRKLLGTNLLAVTGTPPRKGSFRGTTGVAFTGSWNCNGVVYKTP